MISVGELTAALEKERLRLKMEEFDTEFMKGIIQGLSLAKAITRDLWEEAKNSPYANRRRLYGRAHVGLRRVSQEADENEHG